VSILIEEMADFVALNQEFARHISRAEIPGSCKLWAIGKGVSPVPMVPKYSAGEIWLGWQRLRSSLACAIGLDRLGVDLLRQINAQRVAIMT
jgi:hypothetical protein